MNAFSHRAIFVASFIIAAFFAQQRVAAQPAPLEQQKAADEIERLGGRIYRGADGQVENIAVRGDTFGDAQLPLLQPFSSVKILYLDDSLVTDEGLANLPDLPQLKEIYLKHTAVTPDGVAAFKRARPSVFVVYQPQPGFSPFKMVLAAAFLLPGAGGFALIFGARRKQQYLSPRIMGRAYALGGILIATSAITFVIAILQSLGFDVNIANLFD